MRNPPDDAAGPPASRRRGHHGSTPGGPRAAESSVFVPGYDNQREPGPERHAPGQGDPGAPWLGSAAGGAAGKGPVRGYPPLPGQPLPMYPPGQFAAWNRGPSGQGRQPGAARPPTPAGPQASGGRQIGPPPGGRPAGSGYYGRDGGHDAEPGYSVLAVSDPAADVTSTQTWQAVDDGRATGTWTSPSMRGEPPERDMGPARLATGHGPGAGDTDIRPGRHSGFETGTGSRQA